MNPGLGVHRPDIVRVGLISDTHGLLRPEALAALAGVDHIVHAGDVGDPDFLIELGAIAPVTAVWGNVDGAELRARLPEIARKQIGGISVVVVHGHQFVSPKAAEVARSFPDAHLVVFGHSHRWESTRVGETLAVNPGSAGPPRFTLPVTLAVARIGPGILEVEFIDLLAAGGPKLLGRN